MAATRALLTRYNLSRFWQGDAFNQPLMAMDGFFGQDYQRISFAFTELRRDSLRPEVFHVAGKTRFHKTITPFAGELIINTLHRLLSKQGTFDRRWDILDADSACQVYSAQAAFTFHEDVTVAGAGEFVGTAHLDFYLDAQHDLQLAMSMFTPNNLPTKGAGTLYEGQWTSYRGNLTKPFLLSSDIFLAVPPALVDFSIGDREPTFNPKYAKLGWNEEWSNEEWWADSPKPKLNL